MYTEKFIRYLQYEKRFSVHTVSSYQSDLEQFRLFLENQYELKDITQVGHFYIRSWIVSLMDSGRKARSVNRKISTLRSFYRFLLREGIIETNPMMRIAAPKIPSRLPHFVHQEKMKEVLSEICFEDSDRGRLERLVLEILYATGMRRAELATLRIGDIDFGQGVIRVTGKRNKERIIPMLPSLAGELKKYLEWRIKVSSGDQLLVKPNGKPLLAADIYSIVKKHLTRAGAPGKKSPHVLRHTFATHLLNNGADINAIKEILGHASLAATQVYTHTTIEQLKAIYKQTHPKA